MKFSFTLIEAVFAALIILGLACLIARDIEREKTGTIQNLTITNLLEGAKP